MSRKAQPRNRASMGKPDGGFGERCYEMFDSAMAVARPCDMEADVTVWTMHEIFLLARKHPTWSEQRVWAEALFNSAVEWDMWWEP